jgi:hypothetical protein
MIPLPTHPTPKQEFVTDERLVKAHRELIYRDDFQLAIKTALAQYTRVMCDLAPSSLDSPNQLQGSAMCFQRIQGANDLVAILMRLAEIPKPADRKQFDNLNHKP